MDDEGTRMEHWGNKNSLLLQVGHWADVVDLDIVGESTETGFPRLEVEEEEKVSLFSLLLATIPSADSGLCKFKVSDLTNSIPDR